MEESFKVKPKPLLKLSATNSFITNNIAKFRAIQLGLNFDNVTKVGIGYNWLASNINRPLVINGENIVGNQGELRMRYVAPFIEYTFLEREKYLMTIPVQIGIGSGNFKYKLEDGSKLMTEKVAIGFYEPGMTFEYKLWKYLGVGAGIGYRLMFIGNKNFEDQFTSPTYSIKVKLYFGRFVKDVLHLDE